MTNRIKSSTGLLALAATTLMLSTGALAAPDSHDGRRQQQSPQHHDSGRQGDSRDQRQQGGSYQQGPQHSHQQQPQQPVTRAPAGQRGSVVPQLPSGYRMVHHRDHDYYYVRGLWYRPHGGSFIIVMPPVGLSIPVLPTGYVTLTIGGQPYYRYEDVYYEQRGAQYVVVDAPSSAQTTSSNDALFIYPARNQSEQQQAQDKYECHQWGSDQTGYDPTQPYGGVAASQSANSRADYQRAMTACLEARGYTVR